MNKYARTIQDTLDLHQYTREEAEHEVVEFLEQSEKAGHSLIRIIVGKGIHSENGGVLGDFVRNLLSDKNYEFNDAKINEGAHGAIDVKL
jgi:DNA-nicking Smr family endonuclease